MTPIVPLLASAGLAVVHLLANRLRFLDGIPRSRWLSVAGGVSVAYVFVHLLPELGEGQRTIGRSVGGLLASVEHHAYVVALAGLVAFYGLERAAKQSRRRQKIRGRGDVTGPGVFWLHVASFGAYNAIIGYLLPRPDAPSIGGLATYAAAMALHFVVVDHGLRASHGRAYLRSGRWILAACVLLGTAVGLAVEVDELGLAVLRAFLSGGIILNVLKEELPEERESRFSAFLAGVAGYAALLLAL